MDIASEITGHRAFPLAALLLLGTGPVWGQTSLDTQAAIQQLAEAEEYAAASELGDELLAQLGQEYGESSREVAEAHYLVAALYRADSDYVESELHLLRAIEIHTANEGPVTTSLIAPLLSLAETYHESANYELAMASYDEARTIGRRAYGLLNQHQVAILDRMSVTALAMRDLEEAKNLQLDALELVQRYHGEDSLEFLDANYRYAQWMSDYAGYYEAQRAYYDIQRLIDKHFDKEPIMLVRLLRTQAENYRNVVGGGMRMGGFGPTSAGASIRTQPAELEQALKLVERLDVPDPLLHAMVLRDLGDWNVALSRTEDIERPYLEAWAILQTLDNQAYQREWFSDLEMIRMSPIRSRMLSANENAPWGRIEIEFSIDTQGRAGDFRVIASNPPGLLDGDTIRQLANSRFRPRIEDGQLIRSTGKVGWDFQYDPAVAERFGITQNIED